MIYRKSNYFEGTMRKSRLAMWLACGVSFIACYDATNSPTEPSALNLKTAAGSKDKVNGKGKIEYLDLEFKVNAQSDPLGGDPKGHLSVSLSIPNRSFDRAEVTCLLVIGNRAIVGAQDPTRPEPIGVFIGVEDNSVAGPGDLPDRAIVLEAPTFDQAGCLAASAGLVFLQPLTDGNVHVRDAVADVP